MGKIKVEKPKMSLFFRLIVGVGLIALAFYYSAKNEEEKIKELHEQIDSLKEGNEVIMPEDIVLDLDDIED